MEKKPITHEDLRQFTGDLERYRTPNRSVIYTPGIAYLAEHAGAYWLIDAIASCSPRSRTSFVANGARITRSSAAAP